MGVCGVDGLQKGSLCLPVYTAAPRQCRDVHGYAGMAKHSQAQPSITVRILNVGVQENSGGLSF